MIGRACRRLRFGHSGGKAWRTIAVALAALAAGLATARADVVLVNPITAHFNANLVPAPPSTVQEALYGGANVFEEQHDVLLGAPLQVDISDPGIPGVYSTGDSYAPGVIPAGTRVSSFFIHYDTPGVNVGEGEFLINTDADILGVILTDNLLDASDPILGNAGTIYPTGLQLRGTTSDPTEGNDKVTVGFFNDVTSRTLIINMQVGAVLDQIRVITAVPEPSGIVLAAMALGSLALFARRRRGAKA